jgi:hypothetical protein
MRWRRHFTLAIAAAACAALACKALIGKKDILLGE